LSFINKINADCSSFSDGISVWAIETAQAAVRRIAPAAALEGSQEAVASGRR
jgi:hypothetical protein